MSLPEALNPNTSAKRLQEILDLDNPELCQAVAINPNSPPQVLLELFTICPLEVLKNPVLNLILLEIPDFLEQLLSRNYTVLYEEDLPELILEVAVNHPNLFIQRRLTLRHNLPEYYLEKLADKADDKTRYMLVQNQDLPMLILEKLAAARSPQVRLAVANPNINSRIIKILFAGKNYQENTDDLERIKYAIELEIKRLNWTEEIAQKSLKEKCDRTDFYSLTNRQLLEFWQYLRSLKSDRYPSSLRPNIFVLEDIPF